MKKLVLVLVVAFVAGISFNSCKKYCSCKTYALGVAGAAVETELPSGKKCADLNTVVDDATLGKTGIECE